jgi:hypothetical protein
MRDEHTLSSEWMLRKDCDHSGSVKVGDLLVSLNGFDAKMK